MTKSLSTPVIAGLADAVGRWLDRQSYLLLVALALMLALAPLIPRPHLVETTTMLVAGELTEAVYIFDFFMHSAGLVLVGAKVLRDRWRSGKTKG